MHVRSTPMAFVSSRARVGVILAACILAACVGDDASPSAAVRPTEPSSTDVPAPDQPAAPDARVLSGHIIDPATVSVCDVLPADAAASLIGSADSPRLRTAQSADVVQLFGEIRSCAWSTPQSDRGLNLGVSEQGPTVKEFLGLSLVADSTLGFDRRPVEVGDVGLAQAADSASLGVSRLCVATQALGALWLACLDDPNVRFGLDDPELAELTDLLADGLAAL